MSFKYRDTVLEELSRHGIKADIDTPPDLVHEFLDDLYRYEIRALKRQLTSGLIPLRDYSLHVTRLRERYPLLSLPVRFWTEE
jgi:hypothetical protein